MPHFSDFDLMAVVRDPKVAQDEVLWASLEKQAQAVSGRTPVSLIAHDIKQINKEVRAGTAEERLRYAERGFACTRPPRCTGARSSADVLAAGEEDAAHAAAADLAQDTVLAAQDGA